MLSMKRNSASGNKDVLSNFNHYVKKFIEFFIEKLCHEERGSCEYLRCLREHERRDKYFDFEDTSSEPCSSMETGTITYELPVENTPLHLIETLRECSETERSARVCLNNSTCMANIMYNNISRTFCQCMEGWGGEYCEEWEGNFAGSTEVKEGGFDDLTLCFLLIFIIIELLTPLYSRYKESSKKLTILLEVEKKVILAGSYLQSIKKYILFFHDATLKTRERDILERGFLEEKEVEQAYYSLTHPKKKVVTFICDEEHSEKGFKIDILNAFSAECSITEDKLHLASFFQEKYVVEMYQPLETDGGDGDGDGGGDDGDDGGDGDGGGDDGDDGDDAESHSSYYERCNESKQQNFQSLDHIIGFEMSQEMRKKKEAVF